MVSRPVAIAIFHLQVAPTNVVIDTPLLQEMHLQPGKITQIQLERQPSYKLYLAVCSYIKYLVYTPLIELSFPLCHQGQVIAELSSVCVYVWRSGSPQTHRWGSHAAYLWYFPAETWRNITPRPQCTSIKRDEFAEGVATCNWSWRWTHFCFALLSRLMVPLDSEPPTSLKVALGIRPFSFLSASAARVYTTSGWDRHRNINESAKL